MHSLHGGITKTTSWHLVVPPTIMGQGGRLHITTAAATATHTMTWSLEAAQRRATRADVAKWRLRRFGARRSSLLPPLLPDGARRCLRAPRARGSSSFERERGRSRRARRGGGGGGVARACRSARCKPLSSSCFSCSAASVATPAVTIIVREAVAVAAAKEGAPIARRLISRQAGGSRAAEWPRAAAQRRRGEDGAGAVAHEAAREPWRSRGGGGR